MQHDTEAIPSYMRGQPDSQRAFFELHDVVFVCDGKEFPAHKAMLAMHSPVSG